MQLELEAVRAFAACCAVSPELARKQAEGCRVGPESFEDSGLGALYGFLSAQVERGERPDVIVAKRALQGLVKEKVLLDVLTTDSGHANTGPRLQQVYDAACRRQTLGVLASVAASLKDTTKPYQDAVSRLVDHLASNKAPEPVRTLQTDVTRFMERLDAMVRGGFQRVIPTGIPGLDKLIGGLQPTLTVIGGMEGVGKSALISAIVRNIAQAGVKVGVFSLEDEAGWLVDRFVAKGAGVALSTVLYGGLTGASQVSIGDATQHTWEISPNILVRDTPGMTTKEIVLSAKAMCEQGAKAIIVDHLGEIRIQRSDRHDLDIAEAVQDLRAISKRYTVPMVLVCHMKRREGLDKYSEPRSTDFAFSSSLEKMARVALGISLTKRDDYTRMRVSVLKQTNGAAGTFVDIPVEWRAAMADTFEIEQPKDAVPT